MSRKSKKTILKNLISKLPEVYQPIYTHPEHSCNVSRGCQDRLEHIVQVYSSLAQIMQRPLRVLDLGSAQGFFSFSLAEIGASVHGVDYLDENVAVCNKLAVEHKNLDVSFQIGRIEDYLGQLESGQYDLVLGLSVFHHILQEQGVEAVGQILSNLASKVEAGIFELAQSSEPMYWAEAQPEESRQLLKGFTFVHELSQHETHLSDITRPLYFASNRFWYFSDQIGVFDSMQAYSHEFAMGSHLDTRHYYFDDDYVVKQYNLDKAELSEVNLAEFHREITFLDNPPPGFNAPRLVLRGQHESEAWMVRSKLPGELLLDIMRNGKQYDPAQVLNDILKQLVVLEAAGLYHNDMRVWNVLIDTEGGATLLDYGSISKIASDCVWPHDIFLSFLIFVYEVTVGVVDYPIPTRTARISPFGLNGLYRRWMVLFWSQLPSEWSFKLLHEIFSNRDTLPDNYAESDTSMQRWMQAIEEAIDLHGAASRDSGRRQQILDNLSQDITLKLDYLQTQDEEQTQSLSSSKVALIEYETIVDVLSKELGAAKSRLEELSGKVASTKETTARLSAQLNKKAEEYNAANCQIDELHQSNHHWWSMTEQLGKELEEAKSKIGELNQSSHHWWLEADRLNIELRSVYNSKSWLFTWPLRKFSQFLQWFFYLPIRFIVWLGRLPKRVVRRFILEAMSFTLKRPALRVWLSKKLKKFPKVYSKLSRLAEARGLLIPRSQYSPQNHLEIQGMLPAVKLDDGGHSTDIGIDQNKRVVLFYVEHTAMFDRVTGVQRVCHKLSSSLANNYGEVVVLVKLDAANLEFSPLNQEELQRFVSFSGFKISQTEARYYAPEFFETLVNSLKNHARKSWLIIPEVTYHSVHMPTPTSRLIKLARDHGLKVGVIAYDMIPLITEDASSNAQKHMNYISDISLADVIWPISNYASKGLADYLWHDEQLSVQQMPVVSAIPLAEEKNGARVMLNPNEAGRNILCLGTIDERKNQITLIKAFNQYCEYNQNDEWKLQIVGLARDDYKKTIEKECKKNPNIELYYSASDEEIDSFFQEAAFTVFPSLEEGYGLPIVESLWHLRPCICANFGSMYELTKKGGCLPVDVRDVSELVSALSELIQTEDVYKEKVNEILGRNVKTWHEYAEAILNDMDLYQFGNRYSGLIYYWVDATLTASGNTGIQRVNRQLAKQLIQQGHRLVPVKWDDSLGSIDLASPEDLECLEKWNGPDRNEWYQKLDLEKDNEDATYLMVDLPLNRPLDVQQRVIDTFHSRCIKCAAIFYDAIPYKLSDIYPVNFTSAHAEYMTMLDQMDSVFSISKTSNSDLLAFLSTTSERGLLLDQRLKAVALPAEFPVPKRLDETRQHYSDLCTVLAIGTVEPRKNHVALLKAFLSAEKQSQRKLKLVLVGSSDTFDHELADKVEVLINQSKNIVWIKDANDAMLEQQYYEADFTIFPSVEEGFGLPIVESLWFGRPCICANFGQMMELATGGGCLPVDVNDNEKFSEAIRSLANDQDLYQKLKSQIPRRYFRTWDDYASEISSLIQELHRNKKPEYREGNRNASFKLPQRPLLSVCITTYERTDWLELNIENFIDIAKHLGRQVELVVCDNASSKSVGEIFSKYQNHKQISFYSNNANIGMLGNLPQTVSLARGDYVWLIGDDDIIHNGSLEKIINIIQTKKPELINLNYAHCADPKPPKKEDLNQYLKSATKICNGSSSHEGLLKELSCYNENFYTAIYSFVAKRSYAWRIYSQDTSGQPFSSLQTCVPTTKYILSNMMEIKAYWESEPHITVNLNVSWGQYAPLWILERIPEVYDLAELNGISTNKVDQWRRHTLNNSLTFLEVIYTSETPELYSQFNIIRFIRRYRHLREFGDFFPLFETIYEKAFEQFNPLATIPPEHLKGLCYD